MKSLVEIKREYDQKAEHLDEFRLSPFGIHFRWTDLRRDGCVYSVPAEAISPEAKELENQRNSEMEKTFPGITRAVHCRRFWQFLPLIEGLGKEFVDYVSTFKNFRAAWCCLTIKSIPKNQFYGFWKICRVINNKEKAIVK